MASQSPDNAALSPADERKRWVALYVLCIGVLMIVLDATVVNVALPYIQQDLNFTNANLAWTVNAYMIAFGGLLLLSGRLGDLIGRKTMLIAGLIVFTLASLLCGVAQSQEMLIAARFIQGVGGAMASAVTLGMIVTLFPDPRNQAKAIGMYAFVASAGGSIGLLAGGLLTEALNWHWIFFINLPIGIATIVMANRLIERDHGIGLKHGADIPGALLITGSLMLCVYTIVEPAAKLGWTAQRTLTLGAISALLLIGFILRQSKASNPLMPLRIFRSRNVSGANTVQALSVAGMFGLFFLGTLYLEKVLGFKAIQIGLAFLPLTLVMGVLSLRYAEQLIMRFGARNMLLPGLALITVALLLLSRVPVDGNYFVDVMPAMLLVGFGGGLCFPSLMTLAMSGATPSDAGLASGLLNTSVQVGGAVGLAVLATLSGSRSEKLLADGATAEQALTGGYHLAFGIGAVLVIVSLLIAAFVIVSEHSQPTVDTAPEA